MTLAQGASVGILDWGIGGMDFYGRLRRARPDVSVVYLSDTGAPPYGTLRPAALAERVARAVAFLGGRGATEIVVACNAASTVLETPRVRRAIEDAGASRAMGVIAPTLAAVDLPRGASVGVVGGRRTVLSRAYQRPLAARGLVVHQRIGQPLSALVERGELEGTAVEAAVRRVLSPMPKVDALVVACTHYLALLPLLRAHHAGPIVDPTGAALDALLGRGAVGRRREGRRTRPRVAAGVARPLATSAFFTTGDVASMRRAARDAFGVALDRVHGPHRARGDDGDLLRDLQRLRGPT